VRVGIAEITDRDRYPGVVTSVRIESVALSEPMLGELIAELDADLHERYPEEGAVHDRLDPDEVGPGRGVVLVAVDDETGEALGCGAVRLREPGVGEIKRMYVRPEARCRGIATALLAALEAEAGALFADRVVLEIGERQTEAVSLYRRAGYTEIERFGEYVDSPLSLCMGRTLD
jgi:putative acetyltransferase